MSLSIALTTALTGLTANARMAGITASNVSNALTEGYARRELLLSAQSLGGVSGGVRIDGVQRHINAALLGDLRLAAARAGSGEPSAGFLARFETLLGTATEGSSLSGRIAALERSLVEAAARPDAESRLAAVADAATGLVRTMNMLSDDIQSERERADLSITTEVDLLNGALRQVADLNRQVATFRATGRDTSALLDQRQQAIDLIAATVPLKEIAKENGQIALYTTTGTKLVDGSAAEFGFTPTRLITADMTLGSTALSGLSIDGRPITTAPGGGMLGEGRLSALFALRDEAAPSAQAMIDGLARDLIERFADGGLDPTLAAGLPGLFTDGGALPDPLDEAGLAGRIAVNTAVLPEKGGDWFRLRDGIGAVIPGATGNGTLLAALGDALAARRLPVSTGLPDVARSLSDMVGSVLSGISTRRLVAEQEQSFAVARSATLKSELLADGVDTDQEMQTLLQIEKAYAANARVIQAADEMLNTLLGI